jgi:hypothetical protein
VLERELLRVPLAKPWLPLMRLPGDFYPFDLKRTWHNMCGTFIIQLCPHSAVAGLYTTPSFGVDFALVGWDSGFTSI